MLVSQLTCESVKVFNQAMSITRGLIFNYEWTHVGCSFSRYVLVFMSETSMFLRLKWQVYSCEEKTNHVWHCPLIINQTCKYISFESKLIFLFFVQDFHILLNVDEIDFFVSDSVLSWKSIACEDSSGSAFHKKKRNNCRRRTIASVMIMGWLNITRD